MSAADALPWISATVALGGLAIAGLSQWLTYRERTSGYRLRIYDKQVEAMQELSVVLSTHLDALLGLLTGELVVRGVHPLTDQARVRIRTDTASAHLAVAKTVVKWQVILPDNVTSSISKYNEVVQAATAPSSVANGYIKRGLESIVTHLDPGTPIVEAYSAVIQRMREAIGTEPLSQTNLRMIGTEATSANEGK